MKKGMYALIVLLVVVSGLVFANQHHKNEVPESSASKPPCASTKNAEMKKWEATPAGINFKNWQASPQGEKVLAGAAKINKHVRDSSKMEAVVTATTLPPGSRLGFGVMVRINGEDYILGFGPGKADEFKQLHNLKVNDRIIIRSHFVSYAPKYAYPIVRGDYVEQHNKIIYKRAANKDGC